MVILLFKLKVRKEKILKSIVIITLILLVCSKTAYAHDYEAGTLMMFADIGMLVLIINFGMII